MITIKDIYQSREIKVLLETTAIQMTSLGYNEHSFRHCRLVSEKSGEILKYIKADERIVEIGKIAGYIHDIGNAVNRVHHAFTGSLLAYDILVRKGVPYEEAAMIMIAIANHDEGEGNPVNQVGAALILADKADVHRSRVTNRMKESFDIHDRVNYAVTTSTLSLVDKQAILDIEIDTKICPVMDYFEIFLNRMKMCRRSAEFLDLTFVLKINGTQLL